MATCGQLQVVAETGNGGGEEPTDGEAPTIPGIGPLTLDNERALLAGAGLGLFLLSRR